MKLILKGHDRYAAVEQAMLNFFPERPDGEAVVSLSRGETWTTATVRVTIGEKTSIGYRRVKTGEGQIDNTLKQAFFKAAGPYLKEAPPWGSLTGIRPAKLAAQIAAEGKDPKTELCRKYHVSSQRSLLAAECAKAAFKAKETLSNHEISLYVGIPFCPSRCAYCSFVSNAVEKSGHLIEPYLERLTEELALIEAMVCRLGLKVASVYIGGGTPTVLSASQLERLCAAIEWARPREYTIEAGRPDSISGEKLDVMKRFSVGRISINPQTLRDDILRAIGRAHTADETRRSFRIAREAGFDCINTDIIAGLPGDTPDGFNDTLDEILGWSPENITVHTLSLKKGARLETEKNPYGQGVEKMLDYAQKSLMEHGYKPYYLYRQKFMAGGFENVGWCKPDRESLYNLCMMEELHTVVSAGAGGVTKMIDPKKNRIERSFHCKFPLEYLQKYDKMLGGLKVTENFIAQVLGEK